MRRLEGLSPVISPAERAFFEELGERIRSFRNSRQLTQAQLGEALGVSQAQIVAYEKGLRRLQVFSLPTLTRVLGVSLDELVGEDRRAGKRGPAPKLQQQLERLAELPKSQQKFVSKVIDSVLHEAGR